MELKDRILNFAEEMARSLLSVALYCAVVGGALYFAYGAAMRFAGAGADAASDSPAAWQDVPTARPALSLDMNDFIDGTALHVARKHPGGGRRDLVTWISSETQKPVLAIDVYRRGEETEQADAPLLADFAEVALQPEASQSLLSKFGTFEVRSTASADGRACLSFAQAASSPMRISGVYCHSAAPQPAWETVACALDRLTLVNAHGDARLAGVFARAQLKQSSCELVKLPAASIPQRSAWIDADGSPALRVAKP